MLEEVLVLPGLLGGGLVGGEEERGALRPHMTPLHLVDGGVRPPGAGLDDIVHVVGMQPDLQDRHIGVVLQDPLQPVGEGARRLVGGEEGRVRRMRAMVVPEGTANLVSGWAVRSVHPNPSGPA